MEKLEKKIQVHYNFSKRDYIQMKCFYDVLNDVKEESSLGTSGLSRQAIDAKTLLGEALKTMPAYGQMLLKYGKRKSLVNQDRLPK